MDVPPNPDPSDTSAASATPFEELRLRLADVDWSAWAEREFEVRALNAFEHQYEACEPYRALCDRRGVTPSSVATWEDVPAVPATAFKYFDLVSPPAEAEAGAEGTLFLTSGTTRGAAARGRHHVPSLDLYRASLAEPFRRALLPELEPGDDASALFVSLIPSPEEAPTSSLSFMVGEAAQRFSREVVWLVDGEGRWRDDAVRAARRALEASHERSGPVLLLGTALSFVHLMERSADGMGFGPVPRRARVMETGGFKGSSRSVTREALYSGIEAVTGVSPDRIVNEYGMTELLSQLYASGSEGRVGLHVPPPWLKVRALDPDDLAPLPEGRDGILAFFDLANLGSVCHVLTEDVGSIHGVEVRLQGRALGSEPRGCSRAMDDLMTASRG